jgi:Domain of unknown function (DUF3291)
MLASVTRLRVRSFRFLPSFLYMTSLSRRQVLRAAGLVGGKLLVDRSQTYWTLTVWEGEAAMKAFRGAGDHGKAMKRLAKWCDEAAYARWETAGDAIPSWSEAYARLSAEGKLSRVEYPSEDHAKRIFREPRLSPAIGQDLKPKSGK